MSNCICSEINARNCPVHQGDADKAKSREFWISPTYIDIRGLYNYVDDSKAIDSIHLIEYSAFTALQAENERLKSIIAKEMSENDEFGAEYVHVSILKAEIAKLKEAYGVVRSDMKEILEVVGTSTQTNKIARESISKAEGELLK